MGRLRVVLVVAVVVAALGALVAVVAKSEPAPPDVLWRSDDGSVAASPGGPALRWDVVDHMLEPEDRFWIAITVVPRRSRVALWLERLSDDARLATMERAWFYWRCSTTTVDGPATYAFTGLRGDEAARKCIDVAKPLAAFRDAARARIGAERFDRLSESR